MGIQIELNKGRVPVKVWTRDIEPDAIQQLLNIASPPIVQGHMRPCPMCMPESAQQWGALFPRDRFGYDVR